MPTSYTGLLGLALPVTGELTGTWGDTVNNFITQYADAAVAGTQTISGSQTAVTLSVTNGATLTQVAAGSTGSAQYRVINCTGNPATTLTVTVPSSSRVYEVLNSTTTNQSVVIKGAATTGVTLAAGERAVVAWSGTDFVKVASSAVDGVSTITFGTTGLTPATPTSGAVTVAGTLVAANGGTGSTSLTANNVILGNGTNPVQFVAPGASGNVLTSNGTTWTSAAASASLLGDTDSASPFETSLGFEAGLNTTGIKNTFIGYQAGKTNTAGRDNTAVGYNALLNCNGANDGDNTAVGSEALAAVTTGTSNTAVGSRALSANTGSRNTSIGWFTLFATTTGNDNVAIGNSAADKITTGSHNVVIGSEAGTTGTNDLTTGSNNILIGFNAAASSATVNNEVTIGNTSITSTRLRGMVQFNAAMLEQATVSATAATGTITFNALGQSVLYYTANATGNFTINVNASGTTLNAAMLTGQSVTVAFLNTNGATAFYNTAFQVDGAAVTPKWQGGTAPTSGNANSIDVYLYNIIKTGNAAFTVLASQTRFA